jgi:hypothetical protein
MRLIIPAIEDGVDLIILGSRAKAVSKLKSFLKWAVYPRRWLRKLTVPYSS